MNHDAIRAGADALQADLEAHYNPTLTAEDRATLRHLDDAAIDGTLTEGHLKRTRDHLQSIRLRSYAVDHATGQVDPAYWKATDSAGRTNLSHRKSIHGRKHITRHGHLFRVSFGKGSDRVQRDFTSAPEAHLWRDCEIERRITAAAIMKAASQEPYRDEEQARILAEAKAVAEERKAAIREALKPDPLTGKAPSMSEVMRRPEFDRSGEPPKAGATPRKSPVFDMQYQRLTRQFSGTAGIPTSCH